MYFSSSDTQGFIEENDIKFIRMSFCDTFGNMKNIAVMPSESSMAKRLTIKRTTPTAAATAGTTIVLRRGVTTPPGKAYNALQISSVIIKFLII